MKKSVISIAFLCMAVVPHGVFAASTDTRLRSLEQVTEAQGGLIVQLRQQLDTAYRDIDTLRGQLEYNTHQLNQAIERQKTILLQLSGNGSTSSDTGYSNVQNDVSDEPQSIDSTDQSYSSSSFKLSGNDKQDYDAILDLVINQNQRDAALSAFQEFIKTYPQSQYSANATYWIGQIFYNQGKIGDASFYFASVVKNFPKSEKAAECMYKVGLIMEDRGYKEKAKAVYQQVISKYPKASITNEARRHLALM